MAHSVNVQHTLSSCILPIAFSDSLAKHFLLKAHVHMTQVRSWLQIAALELVHRCHHLRFGVVCHHPSSRLASVPLPAGGTPKTDAWAAEPVPVRNMRCWPQDGVKTMGYCEELMIHDITIWEYVGLSIGMINKHGEKDYQQLGLGFMVDIGIMMLQPVKCGAAVDL